MQFWIAATQNVFDNFRSDTCYFRQKKSPMLLNDIIEMFCSANLPTKTVVFDKCFSELFFNHKDCKNSHLPRFYFYIHLDITKNVNMCFDHTLRVCNLLLHKSYMFDWCRTNLGAKICTWELELLNTNALYLKQPVKHQHSLDDSWWGTNYKTHGLCSLSQPSLNNTANFLFYHDLTNWQLLFIVISKRRQGL